VWVSVVVNGPLPPPRSSHCAVVLGNEHLFVYGGFNSDRSDWRSDCFVLEHLFTEGRFLCLHLSLSLVSDIVSKKTCLCRRCPQTCSASAKNRSFPTCRFSTALTGTPSTTLSSVRPLSTHALHLTATRPMLSEARCPVLHAALAAAGARAPLPQPMDSGVFAAFLRYIYEDAPPADVDSA
jgi:hypothetical protein